MAREASDSESSLERVRTGYQQFFYDSIGDWYDNIMRVLYRGRDHVWRKHVVDELDSEGQVLELGAGTGRTESHDPEVEQYVALDVSRSMLSSGDHLRNPTMGDAHVTPFRDNSFDSVVAVLLMSTQINHDEVLREVRRVLKPGGKVYLVDTFANEGNIGRFVDKLFTVATYPVAFKLDVDIESIAQRQGYDIVDKYTPEENIRWFELVDIVTLRPRSTEP